jgi:hypothetical protein
MPIELRELTTLRFSGPRFEDHGLDLDVLPELLGYKRLVVATAKELWRTGHPGRERLPRGFEERVRIKMTGLLPGSVAVPLVRELAVPAEPWLIDGYEDRDEVEHAVELLDAVIDAAGHDALLPSAFPAEVLPMFADFGRTLAEGETIALDRRGALRSTTYTSEIRDRLSNWSDPVFQDEVTVTGEVRAADIDGSSFVLRIEGGPKVPGRFTPELEERVTEALRAHGTSRLRITGMGELLHSTGAIKRLVRVDDATVVPAARPDSFDATAPLIWETAIALGAAVHDTEWDALPSDLARNLDVHLYRSRSRP